MNPNLCRVVLRPRGPLEVFDLTVQLIRDRWRPLARLTLLMVGLPWLLVCVPLCWLTDGHLALLAIPLVAVPLVQAPFTLLGGRLLFADELSVRDVLGDLVGRGGGLVWSTLMLALGWLISIAVCGILLPVVQPGLLYLPETALLERVPARRGINRSVRLAGGHAGIALVGAGAWWFLLLWGALVGEATGQAVVGFLLQLGEPLGAATSGQVTPWMLGGMLLVQPLHALYRLMLYVDVRTRVEGWDLQVGLRAAGLAR
ncbi:MAG: hypothetical protein ACI8PZ_002823 [Myxococcota bacterium]|jgi:hypothetical protein